MEFASMALGQFVKLTDQVGREIVINPALVRAIVDAGDGLIQVFFTEIHFYNIPGELDAVKSLILGYSPR